MPGIIKALLLGNRVLAPRRVFRPRLLTLLPLRPEPKRRPLRPAKAERAKMALEDKAAAANETTTTATTTATDGSIVATTTTANEGDNDHLDSEDEFIRHFEMAWEYERSQGQFTRGVFIDPDDL